MFLSCPLVALYHIAIHRIYLRQELWRFLAVAKVSLQDKAIFGV